MAGLIIDKAPLGSSLDRCDLNAVGGPWAVVIRGPGGSLGRRSAVVTFPVDAPTAGQAVTVGRVRGRSANGTITWPIAGKYAHVRGDLGQSNLVAVAARTTIVNRHPSVEPPAGLDVVATGPYRPPTVHEMRYRGADLGETDSLGNGLVYSGIASSGGFEDQLNVVSTLDGLRVAGRPSIVSSVFGGNGTIAWEPMPGLVAYVGYSGAELNDAAVAALHRLALRTQLLNGAQWQSTGPFTANQSNQPG